MPRGPQDVPSDYQSQRAVRAALRCLGRQPGSGLQELWADSGSCGPAGTGRDRTGQDGTGALAPAPAAGGAAEPISRTEPISRGCAAGACRKGPRRAESGRRRGGSSSFHGCSERRRQSRSRWPSGERETRAGSWSSGRTPPTSTTGTGERGGCSQIRPGGPGAEGAARPESRAERPPPVPSLRAGAEAGVSGLILRGDPRLRACVGGCPSRCVPGECVEVAWGRNLCVFVLKRGRETRIGDHWIVPICAGSVACLRFSPRSVFLQDGEGCLQLVHGAAESSPAACQGGG